MTFRLHPTLEKDCITLGTMGLCRLLLMNDSQFPWFILVPEIDGATEIFHLDKAQRGLLAEESSGLAQCLHTLYHADKINIAAIGNLVPQLHVHHVVRYRSDKAWPAPIWGKFPPAPYTEHEIADTANRILSALAINHPQHTGK
jgi:diadenosine tetraphosphate (Ap4A) HIT family hydrolase